MTSQQQASILSTTTKNKIVLTCSPGPGFLQHKAAETILSSCALEAFTKLSFAVRTDYAYVPAAVQLALLELEEKLTGIV